MNLFFIVSASQTESCANYLLDITIKMIFLVFSCLSQAIFHPSLRKPVKSLHSIKFTSPMSKILLVFVLMLTSINSQHNNLQSNIDRPQSGAIFQHINIETSSTHRAQTQLNYTSEDVNHQIKSTNANGEQSHHNFISQRPPLNRTEQDKKWNRTLGNETQGWNGKLHSGRQNESVNQNTDRNGALPSSLRNGNNQWKGTANGSSNHSGSHPQGQWNHTQHNDTRNITSSPPLQGIVILDRKPPQGYAHSQGHSSRVSSRSHSTHHYTPIKTCKTDSDCSLPTSLRINIQPICNTTTSRCEFKSI